jgi:hypothetical protein
MFRAIAAGRLRLLVGAVLGVLAVAPAGERLVARRRGLTAFPVGGAALSLRVERLGALLASWQTVGGCGAGGANGTGVKWIGRNTTGGMFQLMVLNNFIAIPPSVKPGQGAGGYNFIFNTQMGRDVTERWNLSLSVPYLYKHYNDPFKTGPVSNAGVGDINALVTRRLGPTNATSLTAIVGLPTGTYRAQYMNSELTPDEQLGFGRFTGTLQLEHTLDELWGLVVLGGAANYRGGKNSAHNYRAPGASLYSYAGYFIGPLVPTLGVNVTGFTQQDTRGDFGETLDSPVATAAVHASIEWSNPWVAVLAGVYVPLALRGENWSSAGGFALQPWTVALGVSVSPF